MEPILISSLKKIVQNVILNDQEKLNPNHNAYIEENEIGTLLTHFGVKDIKELQDVGLDTLEKQSAENKVETPAQETKPVAEETEAVKAEETAEEAVKAEETEEEIAANLANEVLKALTTEETEGTEGIEETEKAEEAEEVEAVKAEEADEPDETEESTNLDKDGGENEVIKMNVIDPSELGTGAETVKTLILAAQSLNDGGDEGGYSAKMNALNKAADQYGKKDSDKMIDVESTKEALEELSKSYIRQNAETLKEVLGKGKAIELTLKNGKKFVLIPTFAVRGNNNSADAVKDSDNTDPSGKTQNNDISKLIGGLIVGANAYTDNLQIMAKVSFGTDDYDGTFFVKYENTFGNDWTLSASGGAGITNDKKESNTRLAAAVDVTNGKFFTNATVYYDSHKPVDEDNENSFDATLAAGYKYKKDDNNFFKVYGGGYYQSSPFEKEWGAKLNFVGKAKPNDNIRFGGDVNIEIGPTSFNKDNIINSMSESAKITDEEKEAIREELTPVFGGTARANAYLGVDVEDWRFKTGGTYLLDATYDKDAPEGENKFDCDHSGFVYVTAGYKDFSGTTVLNFINGEAIPTVVVKKDNIFGSSGLKFSYCAPTNAEKQLNLPGTFTIGFTTTIGKSKRK